MQNTKSNAYVLQVETELRCEIPESGIFTVMLMEGSAELFGIELAPSKEYIFSDKNVAIFTWYGCKLQTTVTENISIIYVSDSTPMLSYVNTHIQLEAKRDAALANHECGPRVLVCGPSDSGKSTTARILTAYACRLDRTPLYIDLDVGQSSITLPGAIGATATNKFNMSVEDGFIYSAPLLYSLAHNTPREYGEVYNKIVSVLADKVNERMKRDVDVRASGFVINTCGYIDDDGYDILLKCIKSFSIDVVLVMGHDRLYSSLSSSLKDSTTIVKLPQSGGVVRRERQYRYRTGQSKIRDYFYGNRNVNSASGSGKVAYSPARVDVQISSFVIIKAGGLQLSENMRVMGDSEIDATELVRVAPNKQELEGYILSILYADPNCNDTATAGNDEVPQSLSEANVAGFVCIKSIDIDQDKMTLLVPNGSTELPSKYLLLGSIKWEDK